MGKLYSVWLKWIQLDSGKVSPSFLLLTLREKCPNTELFLVRIFRARAEYRAKKNSVLGHFSHGAKEDISFKQRNRNQLSS